MNRGCGRATLGAVSELKTLLDSGLDPNTKTAAGVTLLTDPEKVSGGAHDSNSRSAARSKFKVPVR